MTWAFWDTYADEAYGIVDNKNSWTNASTALDIQKLDGYLREITDLPPEPDPLPPVPKPPGSPVCKTVRNILKKLGIR